MAEIATFKSGYHKIIAVGGDQSFVGVGPIKPTFQKVHIDATVYIWEIKPLPEPGVFRLSVERSYEYTGVEGNRNVIATVERELDREWRINFWPEFQAYSIELKTPIIPTPAWTVSSDKEILTELLVTFPRKTQLFRIVPHLD